MSLSKLSKGRCWAGYEPVPGKEPYSDGSCRPADSKKKKKDKKKEKSASLKGLLGLGLGAGLGTSLMNYGPQYLDWGSKTFTENIYYPAYNAAYPALSHVGNNAGKYAGGALSLAALLATRGKVKSLLPITATSTAALGAGSWWDNARRQAAADKILFEKKLQMDKEKWRMSEDVEDPYALPSAPPAFGQTGWKPSNRPMVNLTP